MAVEPLALLEAVMPDAGIATGVPCSQLASTIDAVRGHPQWRFVPATSEGEAVALAAGTTIAGGSALVLMQNSGLGDALDPLVSLAEPFGVPLVLVVSHRGHPDHERLPQHAVMGRITHDLISLIGLERVDLDAAALAALPAAVQRCRDAGSSLAVVVPPGAIGPCPPAAAEPARVAPAHRAGRRDRNGRRRTVARREAIEAIASRRQRDTVLVSTTGYASRELYGTGDSDANLYLTGSMGFAGAFGLGISLARPDLRVVILDGDGSALMALGSLATAGAFAGPGYRHVILDNGVHDSTGGQPTVSSNVSFAAVAEGVGFAAARSDAEFPSLGDAADWILAQEGPALLTVAIRAAAAASAPRVGVSPLDQSARFARALAAGAPR